MSIAPQNDVFGKCSACSDYIQCHFLVLLFQTLSVGILDKNLKLLKRCFKDKDNKYKDLIRGIPLHETLEEVYAFVSDEYFSPGLGHLIPYQYEGRPWVGKPKTVTPTKNLRDVKDEQKDRHVAWHKVALYAQAALGK